MKYIFRSYIFPAILLLMVLSGCASNHYATMQDVQQAVQVGDYPHAEQLLSNKKELASTRNRVLYLLESGLIAHLNSEYRKSNSLLAEAKTLMEELAVFSITESASEWLISDKTRPYYGEDFERVLVHYYMALNYAMLGELEDALVECRQVDLLLQTLNDRYEGKNVYKTDAFLLYLSGLMYDALGETNDAFIDYRNAYDAYTTDYLKYYATPAPPQLTDHLLRTSQALGFSDEFERYQRTFRQQPWTTQEEYRKAARLVVIWNNGLIPYKSEQVFREYIELDDKEDAGCYVKFAFPELMSRVPMFTQAMVSVDGSSYPLELAEDLTQIARKNLADRRLRTMLQATTRNLLKCMAEYELEKHDSWLGLLVMLFTELSEGADTRSWLLLPASIHLTQLVLPPGNQNVELVFQNALGVAAHRKMYRNVPLEAGKTTFLMYRTY